LSLLFEELEVEGESATASLISCGSVFLGCSGISTGGSKAGSFSAGGCVAESVSLFLSLFLVSSFGRSFLFSWAESLTVSVLEPIASLLMTLPSLVMVVSLSPCSIIMPPF